MITPAQSRAARALLNWSQPQLADASGASVSTIRDFEVGKRTPIANNLNALRTALESAGVIFVAENGEGPGVRFSKAAIVLAELCLFLRTIGKATGPSYDLTAGPSSAGTKRHQDTADRMIAQIQRLDVRQLNETAWLQIEVQLHQSGLPLPLALRDRIRSAVRHVTP